MTSRQLNIRLSTEARDRLEALAFIRRTQASVLARDIILDYLEGHASESGLERALEALLERDQSSNPSSNVRPIRA